jgi:mRNA interferase MazF
VSRAPRRGDVFWVALDPALGTEIKKTRPAVVVSNDSCNRYGSRVVVLPITSHVDSFYPGEALVRVKGRPARALGDQIRSLDKTRLSRIGTLSTDDLAAPGCRPLVRGIASFPPRLVLGKGTLVAGEAPQDCDAVGGGPVIAAP